MTKVIQILGKKFNRLKVIGPPIKKGRREYFWPCRCDCGIVKHVRGTHLRNAITKSCGCVHGILISDPVTHSQLRKMVSYDPTTGMFYWLVSSRKYNAGDSAALLNPATGYLTVTLGKHIYNAHVLAWFFMKKRWPPRGVDHEDTDRTNCKWNNLRLSNQSQNIANSKLSKASTTGFKGVSKHTKGRFRAYAQGKHIGIFSDAVSAAEAYDKRAIELFGEFARTNFGVRRARLDERKKAKG